MSTRANIIIKDKHSELIFYRHSDGYPDGVAPTLDKFSQLVNDGEIRDNTGQAAGHLIIIGAIEYNALTAEGLGWKVGAYEPTSSIHGDIEHLYEIDLSIKPVTWREVEL